jgi:hypothetical protein
VKITVVRVEVDNETLDRRLSGKTPPVPVKPIQTRTGEFYVIPERRMHATDGDVAWPDSITGKESMSPAWLVPKLTINQLRQHNFELKPGERKQKFNAVWKEFEFSTVVVGSLADEKPVGSNLIVKVPVLTNNAELKKGDLLIMQREDKPKATEKKPETWKTAEKKKQAAASSGGVAKKPRTDDK